jgi:hypothetical protein
MQLTAMRDGTNVATNDLLLATKNARSVDAAVVVARSVDSIKMIDMHIR